MQPDQIAVTITRQGARVTARTSGPPGQETAVGALDQEYGSARLATPLEQRGVICTIEYGHGGYIVHAELPDHSVLIISPTQDASTGNLSWPPEGWLVTRGHPYDRTVHEVLYNSGPEEPHARNGGSTGALLAAIDARLDQLALPPREHAGALEPFNAADAVLHRAGFVTEVTHRGRFHRLPAGMTDTVEQRHTVTRALGMLRAEGFVTACEADLLDNSLPVRTDHGTTLGDRLSDLTQSISQASHTSQAVAALSELTAPGDGVLERVTEVLDAAADWWKGLGGTADPLYALRLRRINQHIGISIMEIQNLRNLLADRHTEHPLQAQHAPLRTLEPRAATALAFSPTAQRTRPAPLPTGPAATVVPPAARPARTR